MPPKENQKNTLFVICDQYNNCEQDAPDKECWCLFPHYEEEDFKYTCYPTTEALWESMKDKYTCQGCEHCISEPSDIPEFGHFCEKFEIPICGNKEVRDCSEYIPSIKSDIKRTTVVKT